MMCASFYMLVAGGIPSFEGGYLEEEKRRSGYVRYEGANSTYSPAAGDIKSSLFAVSAGYSHSFAGRRTGSIPPTFLDIAGECSSVDVGLVIHLADRDVAGVEQSSDFAMFAARYVSRSPGFTFIAELDAGQLETSVTDTDTCLQFGIGAGSGTRAGSEIRAMFYGITFEDDANTNYTVAFVEGVYLMQPSSERWLALGARWKQVDFEGETTRDTGTLSLSADWYLFREAYVGFELSIAESNIDEPIYYPPPAGTLGEHVGYRVRAGYEPEDYGVRVWIEPRTREDSTEVSWGFSASYKF